MTITNNIYAIYDRKAQYYLPPFTVRGDADAHRTFTEAVMTSETPISQYPADFDLVRVGSIDLESGLLATPENGMPVLLINGLVCLEVAQRERRRYNAILNPSQEEIPFPEAS